MIAIDLTKVNNEITFGELSPGEVFAIDSGAFVYLKVVGTAPFNSVRLATGNTRSFLANDVVQRIDNAKFTGNY